MQRSIHVFPITLLLLGGVMTLVASEVFAQKPGEPLDCLRGLDPVALCEGQELPGDSGITLVRNRYRYRFASAANKQKFEQDPERYAIQLGGGCGRMGPLSGLGSPDRFLVHQGGIYIFASDQCRQGFLSAPEKHIETDDPLPAGTDADLQRGQELVQQALAGLGGRDKVDAVKTLELKRVQVYQDQGANKEYVTLTQVAFPDRYRLDNLWDGGSTNDLVRGDVGYRVDSSGAWPMEEIVRREFIKQFRRHPLVLLKARHEPGFRAVATGKGQVGDRPVEWLAIAVGGATSTWGIEVETGRVLRVQYRGRAPAAIGQVTRDYSDFHDVGGIVLPRTMTIRYNDAPPSAPLTLASLKVDPAFDTNLFDNPK